MTTQGEAMKKSLILLYTLFVSSFAVANTEQYLNLSFWQKFNDDILINNLAKVYENNNDLKA